MTASVAPGERPATGVAAEVVQSADGTITGVELHDGAGVFGWTLDDLVGASARQLVHPDDRAFAARMRRAALEGSHTIGEVRVRAASGRWVWAECHWRTTSGADGAPQTVVELRDVSEKYLDVEAITILGDLRELIGGAADVDDAWERGLEAVVRYGGVAAARAWVASSDGLIVRAETGLTTPGPCRSLAGDDPDPSPVAAVWGGGGPMWIPVVTDTYPAQHAAPLLDRGLRSALLVPVGGSTPVAVIEMLAPSLSEAPSATQLAMALVTRIGDAIERKELETELVRTAAEFRLAFEEAAIGMALVGTDGSMLRANDALARFLGRTPEEIATIDFQSITHPDDLELDVANVEAMLRGELRNYQMEKRYLRADGSVVWALLSVSLVRDVSGAPLHFISQVQDISARKEAERRLKETTARFRAAFDDSAVGMAVVALCGPRPGGLVEVNSTFRLITRLHEQEVGETRLAQLVSPDSAAVLDAAVADLCSPAASVHHSEHRLAGSDESERWVRLTAARIAHGEGHEQFAVVQLEEITEQRRIQRELAHRALHDPLTGLANRALVLERLRHAQSRSERSGGHVGVMFLDLDRFKAVNDTLGHDQGDLLLTVVAERITSCLRPTDTAGRFGGDEFVVVCDDLGPDRAEASAEIGEVAERIGAAITDPIPLADSTMKVSASIGIDVTNGTELSPEELLGRADMAMYGAKRRGRARHLHYDAREEPDTAADPS